MLVAVEMLVAELGGKGVVCICVYVGGGSQANYVRMTRSGILYLPNVPLVIFWGLVMKLNTKDALVPVSLKLDTLAFFFLGRQLKEDFFVRTLFSFQTMWKEHFKLFFPTLTTASMSSVS